MLYILKMTFLLKNRVVKRIKYFSNLMILGFRIHGPPCFDWYLCWHWGSATPSQQLRVHEVGPADTAASAFPSLFPKTIN